MIPFVTVEDRTHLELTASIGLLFALHALVIADDDATTTAAGCHAKAACMHALDTIACAMYRTSETPYAGILCAVFVTLLWIKVFRGQSSHWQSSHWPSAVLLLSGCIQWLELQLSVVHVAYLAEVGVRPQFTHAEDWPFYAVVGLYLTYVVARHCGSCV